MNTPVVTTPYTPPPPQPEQTQVQAVGKIATADDAIEQAETDTEGGLQGETFQETLDNLHRSRDGVVSEARDQGDWGAITRVEQAYAQAEVKLTEQHAQQLLEEVPGRVDATLDGLKPSAGLEGSALDRVRMDNADVIESAVKQLADAAFEIPDPAAAARLVRGQWPKIEAALDALPDQRSGTQSEFDDKALLEQLGRLGAIAEAGGDDATLEAISDAAPGLPSSGYTLDGSAALQGFALYLDRARSGSEHEMQGLERVIGDIQYSLDQSLTDYQEHTRDLNWYVANLGAGASQEDLQKAIDTYVGRQSEAWQDHYHELQSRISDQGRQLLAAVDDARTTLPQEQAQQVAEQLLGSEAAQFAIRSALDQDPALAADPAVAETRDWLATATSGMSNVHATAQSLGDAFLRHTVNQALEAGLSGSADPDAMIHELEALKNDGVARSLGMDPGELDGVIDRLRNIQEGIANDPGMTP